MGPLKRMMLRIAIAKLTEIFSGSMGREKAGGYVRHALTMLAGMLAAKGIIDESLAEMLVSAGMAAFGMIWSVLDKEQRR